MTVRTRLAARRELCYISKLPAECKAQIIDYLPAGDVKNLRLASRDWTDICVRGLFNAFDNPSHCIHGSNIVKYGILSIRPHLDDMVRTAIISSRKEMAKHVKELEIYTGDFETSLFLDSSFEVLAGRSMGELEMEESTAFVEQVLHKIDQNTMHCDASVLSQSFKELRSLESLRITSYDYPFCTFDIPMHTEWRRMWDGWDERIKAIKFGLSVARYRWVLFTASYNLKNPLRRLSLELVPLNVFSRGEEYRTSLSSTMVPREFRDMGIRDLRLLTYLSPENYFEGSTHGSDLASFINSCQSLESLDLSFQGEFMTSKSFRDQ